MTSDTKNNDSKSLSKPMTLHHHLSDEHDLIPSSSSSPTQCSSVDCPSPAGTVNLDALLWSNYIPPESESLSRAVHIITSEPIEEETTYEDAVVAAADDDNVFDERPTKRSMSLLLCGSKSSLSSSGGTFFVLLVLILVITITKYLRIQLYIHKV